MKKLFLLKSLVIAILSIILMINLSTYVFAEDTEPWDLESETNTSAGTNTSQNLSTNENGGLDFTESSNLTTEDNINTDTNISSNVESGNTQTEINYNEIMEGIEEPEINNTTEENTATNKLANTGLEDTSMYGVVIVLGIIVAIYSFKKIKEYNNL